MPTDPRLDYALRPPRLPEPVDPGMAEAPIPQETRLGMYRNLHVLRQFGKRAHDLFLQNLVKGTTHLSLGMEGVSTGFGAAMRSDDYTFATYRGHAHALSRGSIRARPLPSCWAGRTACSAARAVRCI
jgi:acetoin:2,6-dichlorophenolindophenol oxidoreductase subunit alpha